MAKPRFSISEITTFHQTYDEDLESYAAAGVEGVGIWEFKLPEGEDAESVAKLRASGLTATTMIPGTLSIYPVPFPGPDDPGERTAELCAAIRRFAPFEPEVVLCLPGAPPADVDPDEARRVIVAGFKQAARVAAEHGLTLGIEPLHRTVYGTWTTVFSIPETIALMDDIDEPNVKLLYDVYHLHDTDNVIADTVSYGSRISPSVHICDWRDPTRNDFDRVLPGDGIIDLPGIFGALDAAAHP
jgi:sugar phosphate isomerase/epimerase